jgi:hypothetical protein
LPISLLKNGEILLGKNNTGFGASFGNKKCQMLFSQRIFCETNATMSLDFEELLFFSNRHY